VSGPHACSYKVWIWEPTAVQIVDTLSWVSPKVSTPKISSADAASATARELANPSVVSPLAPVGGLDLVADAVRGHPRAPAH
jgi:hypothetical protein